MFTDWVRFSRISGAGVILAHTHADILSSPILASIMQISADFPTMLEKCALKKGSVALLSPKFHGGISSTILDQSW